MLILSAILLSSINCKTILGRIIISIMNNEEEQLKKRFLELAEKAYSRNICTFTGFLGLMEMSIFYEISKDVSYAEFNLSGGADFCERKVIRFGSLDTPYPIDCIHITPTLKKFSDALSHRDFLGALIHLGIKRDVIGDIIVNDNEAFVFCLNSITDFILQNLSRIKHTSVKCQIAAKVPDESCIHIVQCELNVASLRLDAVIGEIYKLSRSQAQLAIRERRVFVNGRLTENNSYTVKPDDVITVRGFGRFIFGDMIRSTKKGRLFITALLYQ